MCKDSFSPHLSQHLLSLVFLMIAIFARVRLYLTVDVTVIKICIFLVSGAFFIPVGHSFRIQTPTKSHLSHALQLLFIDIHSSIHQLTHPRFLCLFFFLVPYFLTLLVPEFSLSISRPLKCYWWSVISCP